MIEISGRYSDGRTLASHPATLTLDRDAAVLALPDSPPRSLAADSVEASPRLANVPRFLRLPDGAVFETPDNDAVDRWLAAAARSRLSAVLHTLESRSHYVAVAVVLLVAGAVLAVRFGLPAFVEQVAARVPYEIEQQIGRAGLAQLDRLLQPSRLSASEIRRLNGLAEPLFAEVPPDRRPRIVFRSSATWTLAMALPGGTIVVTDSLVATAANDEEWQAVLAHELAHLELRHGLQILLRSSTALLVVASATGDLATLTSFAHAVPMLLLRSGYSRDFERAADAWAKDCLERNGIDPRNLAAILRRLESARPARGPAPTYLATHPPTTERMAALGGLPESFQLTPPPTPVPRPKSPAVPLVPPPTRAAPPSEAAPVALTQRALVRRILNPEVPPGFRTGSRPRTSVVTILRVDAQGNVSEIILPDDTAPDLSASIRRVGHHWRFYPAERAGVPVPSSVIVTIRFSSSGVEVVWNSSGR